MDIICFSSEDWEGSLWTNKHHIMSRLAKEHRVLFVDQTPLTWRRVLLGEKTLFNKFDNLWISKAVRPPILIEDELKLKARYLKKAINKLNFKNVLIWAYHPEYEPIINQFDYDFLLYDCVDEISNFPWYAEPQRKREIKAREERLLKSANLVIVTTQVLRDRKIQYNKNTYLVPNVADAKHFSKARDENTKIPDDIRQIKKPIIGFVGAISSFKIDFELLRYLAEKLPECSLVLIGPLGVAEKKGNLAKLANYKNVYFLGEKNYSLLPNYIKAFDICIIPYSLNEYTTTCFPLKFFEFSASGKPIVTTNLPALRKYSSLVKVATNKEEFLNCVKEVLKSDPVETKEARIKEAFQNTWESRVNKILELVNKHWVK